MAVMSSLLALDGHDGSGKTTLARGLAAEMDGVYVRPFGGRVGVSFLAAVEGRRYEEVIRIANEAVNDILSSHANAPLLVFDRLWLTVLSVLPDELFPLWHIRPPTLVCWANLDMTLFRLARRQERTRSVEWHQYYIARYATLAARFGCQMLQTEELDEETASLDVVKWARTCVSPSANCNDEIGFEASRATDVKNFENFAQTLLPLQFKGSA